MRCFGVGCWSFEPRDEEDLGALLDDFPAVVATALGSIPGVRNVTIEGLRGTDAVWPNERFADYKSVEWVLDRSRFLPHPYDGRIEFDVEISETVQESLSGGWPDGIERFHVQIRYTENFPVVFIESMGIARRPSRALIVVREYLWRELRLRDLPVKLTVLGPSPFWVDFFVVCEPPKESGEPEDIEVRRIRNRMSYDDIYFVCRSATDDEEAIDSVFDYVEAELGLYYGLEVESQATLMEWREIEDQISDLVRLHTESGWRASVARWWRAGRQSRQLSLRVLQAESKLARQGLTAKKNLEELKAASASRAFEDDLAQQAENSKFVYPGARDMLALLEARRVQDINLVALLASSMLGGAAGAVLTALAGGGS